jgi:hypothetical protein
MRRTFLLAVVLLLGCTAFAQGNLQFNKAQHLTYTGTISSYKGTISAITVPVGKVWKVESGSILWQWTTQGSREFGGITLTIDSQILSAGNSGNSYGSFLTFNSQPVWLPSGTYNIEYNIPSNGALTTNPYYAALSIIEFNIVQ